MSKNNQIAIRQLAEAEITLKMKENVVKGQKEQHLQKIVLEDEHDLLTNTFSGSYLGQYIEKMITHTETKAAFSLMFISVELVTEGSNYNFRAQETILIEAAALMVRFCTDLQVVARLEANKFAICFPGDQLELSKEHGDAILKGLQEKVFMYEGQRLEVHFNGGLVEYEASHAKDLQGLFRMADLALYQAEKSPRNSLVVW